MIRPFLVVALSLSIAACADGDSAVNTQSERVIPVAVAAARVGPAAPVIRSSAVLAHKDEMRLAFKIGGVIADIAVDEGSPVKAGQVLAQLELAEIGSQVEQTRQLLGKAERDLARGERLYQEQVIPLESLQDLRTQRDIAAQTLKATRFNREYAVITAPSDGMMASENGVVRSAIRVTVPSGAMNTMSSGSGVLRIHMVTCRVSPKSNSMP